MSNVAWESLVDDPNDLEREQCRLALKYGQPMPTGIGGPGMPRSRCATSIELVLLATHYNGAIPRNGRVRRTKDKDDV